MKQSIAFRLFLKFVYDHFLSSVDLQLRVKQAFIFPEFNVESDSDVLLSKTHVFVLELYLTFYLVKPMCLYQTPRHEFWFLKRDEKNETWWSTTRYYAISILRAIITLADVIAYMQANVTFWFL